MKRFATASLLLFITIGVTGQTVLKPASYIVAFKIKNAGITVNGSFKGFSGRLNFSPDNLSTSSLGATVEVSTLSTGNDLRDADLKKEKYFNADKFKQVELTSTKLYKNGNDFAGLFNLTIKGTTKQVEIPFTYTANGNDVSFDANFTIDRRDFGVGDYSIILSDNVTIHILVNAKKQ